MALAPLLMDRTPNGVLVTSEAGRIRVLNRPFTKLLPIVPHAIGRLVQEAIPVTELTDVICQPQLDEAEVSIRLGSRDLVARVVALGKERGRLTIVQDVTRIRQAERYRRHFVANVSHELRTPATAISGYAETLLADRDRLPPDAVRMVEIILRNGRRLTDLFDDLLHLAQLDAMDEPPPLHPTLLAAMATETLDKLSALAESRQVTIEMSIPDDLTAMANRDALAHILGNLVSNAIKYSHEGGHVKVIGRPDDGMVIVEVIDHGIGIDPSHHELIFQRFYRVDKGRTRARGGTGLGLAIVKHLSKAIEADVEVKSRKGHGSTFRLHLQEVPPST